MKIDKYAVLNEIRNMPVLAGMHDNLISASVDFFAQGIGELTIEGLQGQHPTWDADDMVFGLNRLLEIAESRKELVFPVYSREEAERNPVFKQVNLIYHPAEKETINTFVLLLSGGAYGAVCNLPESIPVAARLNEMGITAFSLNYRTADDAYMREGLMPKPIEDVAKALAVIKTYFRRSLSDYVVGGFSAGGHLAQMWGTKYREYGIPKPKMLMLDYPLVSLENLPIGEVRDYICTMLFGIGWDKAVMHQYSAHRLVTESFPKTYAVLAEDDDTVPAQDSQDLEAALEKNGVPHLVERVRTGGHGFGLGTKTDAAGWVDRAVVFLKENLL